MPSKQAMTSAEQTSTEDHGDESTNKGSAALLQEHEDSQAASKASSARAEAGQVRAKARRGQVEARTKNATPRVEPHVHILAQASCVCGRASPMPNAVAYLRALADNSPRRSIK